MSRYNAQKHLEFEEQLQYLRQAGYGWFLDALEDDEVYTANGRINKCALKRKLRIPETMLAKTFRQCQELLTQIS